MLVRRRCEGNDALLALKAVGGGELSKIVGFVSMLGELDTAEVAPLAHPLDTQNVFRDDVPADSLSTAEALQSAPRHDGACFLVPAVLGDSGAA